MEDYAAFVNLTDLIGRKRFNGYCVTLCVNEFHFVTSTTLIHMRYSTNVAPD